MTSQLFNKVFLVVVVAVASFTAAVHAETLVYSTKTACVAPNACSWTVESGMTHVDFKIKSATRGVFQGRVSTFPGAVVESMYTPGTESCELRVNNQLVGNDLGQTSSGSPNVVNFIHDASASVSALEDCTIELITPPACAFDEQLLLSGFHPQLENTSRLTLINQQPFLVIHISAPAHYFDITMNFGSQCSYTVPFTPVSQEKDACVNQFAIEIPYAADCNFAQTESGINTIFSGLVTIGAKVYYQGSTSGTQTRSVMRDLRFSATIKAQFTVSTALQIVNPDTCSSSAECNGQPCSSGSCGCSDGGFAGPHCETDIENPTCIAPGPVIIETASLPVSLPVDFSGPTVSDNYTPVNALSVSLDLGANPTFSSLGKTTATYTVTDEAGNFETCSFDVTVRDNRAPTVSCPSSPQITKTWNSWSPATASDLIDGAVSTVLETDEPTSDGDVTTQYSATDASGNVDTCEFQTIYDTTAPTIDNCPVLTIALDNNSNKATLPTWTAPTTSDATSGIQSSTLAYTPAISQGQQFSLQTMSTVSTISIEDKAGNKATCPFQLRVIDTQAPTVTCQPAHNVNTDDATVAYATVSANTLASSSDNSGAIASSTSFGTQTYSIGSHTLTYQACDASGNCAQCSIVINVSDVAKPTITCPANIIATTDSGLATRATTWTTPSATDNDEVASMTSTHVSGSAFPMGTTTVTYTATDMSNNTESCSFTVTINDEQVPAISCPQSFNQATDSNVSTAVVTFASATASDNDNVKSVTASPVSGSTFSFGPTTVTYTAEDDSGNKNTCSFTVTVIDREDPSVQCPSNIDAAMDAGKAYATVSWAAPSTSDNVTPAPSLSLSRVPATQTQFSSGISTITYTVVDAAGNDATCSFTVTVSDDQRPSVTCPDNVTDQPTDNNLNTAVVAFSATASDNWSIASLTSSPVSSSVFQLGLTTVTFTAVDVAGLSSTCSFTVNVVDHQKPDVYCPASQTLNTDTNASTRLTSFSTSSSDNVGVSSVSTSHTSPFSFPVGTTTVSYTAFDAAGNSKSCSFDMIIEDDEAPVVTCPQSKNVEMDSGLNMYTASWTPASATDNVTSPSNLIVTSDIQQGAVLPIGKTTITYTARDASGNESTCSFDIQVSDGEKPLITCPSSFAPSTDADLATYAAAWTPATASDNNGTPTVSVNVALGTALTIGAHTITYTATDSDNNVASCSFTVTVTDRQKPSVSCPADQAPSTDAGSSTFTAVWPVATTLDNSLAAPTLSVNVPLSTQLAVGPHIITYTSTDAAGNKAECSFTVTVSDRELPLISCPASPMQRSTDQGVSTRVVTFSWSAPTDNVAVVSNTASPASGSTFQLGSTTVTLTATDAAGNARQCQFTVEIVDEEAPVVSCPTAISVYTDAGLSTHTGVTYTATAPTDNVAVTTSSYSIPASNTFPLGLTTVTFSASDAAGNPASCQFTVSVSDNEDPTVTCGSLSMNLPSDSAEVKVPRTASASDNVDGVVDISSQIDQNKLFHRGSHTDGQYCYTDAATNGPACCSFSITVNDVTPPTLSCPARVDVDVSTADEAVASWSFTATDNHDVAPTVEQSHASGALFPIGTTTVEITANDGVNAPVQCSFPVQIHDTGKPVLTCPSSAIVRDIDNNDGLAMTIPHPAVTVTDNSGESLQATTASGTSFNIGTTSVTYSATDSSNNSESCSFNVIVRDVFAPTTTNCPNDATVYLSEGASNPASAPTWSDNWTASAALVRQQSASASGPLTVGQHTVTYTATDAANNVGTCSYKVTIVDDVAPIVSCPNPFSTFTNAGLASGTWSYDLSSLLSSESGLTFASALLNNAVQGSHTFSSIGSHQFDVSVSDVAGNSATCTIQVTVVDNERPTVTCRSDMSERVEVAAGTSRPVSFSYGSASDNSGSVTVQSVVPASGSTFTIGTTTVTVTVVDSANNSRSCSFTVTILAPYTEASTEASLSSVYVREIDINTQKYGANIELILRTPFPHRMHTDPAGGHSAQGSAPAPSAPEELTAACTGSGCTQTFASLIEFPSCNFPTTIYTLNFESACTPLDCVYGSEKFSVVVTLTAENYCGGSLGPVNVDVSIITVTPARLATYDALYLSTDLNTAPAPAKPTADSLFVNLSPIVGFVDVRSNDVRPSAVTLLSASRTFYSNADMTNVIGNLALYSSASTDNVATLSPLRASFAAFTFTEASLPLDTQVWSRLTATVAVDYLLGNGSSGRRLFSLQMATRDDKSSSSSSSRKLLQAGGSVNKSAQTQYMQTSVQYKVPVEFLNAQGGSYFAMFQVNHPATMTPGTLNASLRSLIANQINEQLPVDVIDTQLTTTAASSMVTIPLVASQVAIVRTLLTTADNAFHTSLPTGVTIPIASVYIGTLDSSQIDVPESSIGNNNGGGGGNDSKTGIIGGIIGAVAAGSCVACCFIFGICRRRKNEQEEQPIQQGVSEPTKRLSINSVVPIMSQQQQQPHSASTSRASIANDTRVSQVVMTGEQQEEYERRDSLPSIAFIVTEQTPPPASPMASTSSSTGVRLPPIHKMNRGSSFPATMN